MSFTTGNLATGEALNKAINDITAVQAKNALSGARVHIMVTDATRKQVLVPETKLQELLGDTTYNTICGTALTSINTALASAKSTKQTAFAALGS